MKKTVIYCRTSTGSQEKEETIQTQIFKLRETYKVKKFLKEYLDDGYSGSSFNRPALDELREDANKGLFDIVAIYDFSRLSRNLGHQLALIEELEKAGVKIETLEGDFENNDEGILNRNIRGVINEYERCKITKRFLDGRIRKAKEGNIVTSVPPFGFKRIKKGKGWSYKIDTKEGMGIRKLFKIYTDIDSIRQTHLKFYQLGYRSKKTGGAIAKTTIKYMLTNKAYIGQTHFRDIKIKVPSIIDKAIFNKAQKMLDKDKSQYIKPSNLLALCRGLIKCIHCGKTYGYTVLSKGYRKNGELFCYRGYACRQERNHVDMTKEKCKARRMSGPKLDKYIWEYISFLIKDSEKIKRAVELLQEKREKEKGFNQKVYDSLIIEKGTLKAKKQKLLGLYVDDNITKEDLNEAISNIDSQIGNFNKQVAEAEKELVKINNSDKLENEIEKLCIKYQSKIDNLTFEQKIYVIKKWVKEINILDNGDIKIRVKLPLNKAKVKLNKIDNKADIPIFNPTLMPNVSYVAQASQHQP